MGAAQQQHAQTALADAAADGVGQFAVQHSLVEGQLAAVVAAGGGELAVHALGADADAHAAQLVLLHKGVLTLLRGQVRVLVLQLLGGDEGDVGGVERQILQLREHGVEVHLGGTDRRHDGAHDVLQIRLVPVFLTDDLLPVPLVHIDGVEVVHVLVAADGVHVAVEALAHAEAVIFQGLALPLGQRLHHLCFGAAVLDYPSLAAPRRRIAAPRTASLY